MKSIGVVTFFAAAVLTLGGCAGHHGSGITHPDIPAPLEVAPAPKYKPTPLDPALLQKAKDQLLGECNATDPFLRCNAIEALADTDPPDAQQPVLKGLKDPEPSVRFAAAVAAGRLQLRPAYETLLAMAGDSDLRVRAAVRFALHRLGDTRLSHDLEKLAADFDPRVRASTAQVLGFLREPSAGKILLRLLDDPAAAVRLQAAEALWELGDEEGLDALVGYTISAYPDDQIIAVIALAEPRDQRVIGHVHGALTSDYPEVSLAAARAMGMLGSDLGWNVAVPGAASLDPRQRSLAALAMGAIGRTDLQPKLAKLLADPESTVRISAATALLQLRPPSGN